MVQKQKKFPAEIYAEQVMTGEIIACEYVQLAVKRYYDDLANALDRGWSFDRKAAMRVIRFIENLKHTKGEWAGQKFKLEPWQQFILWNIFGWKLADGTRRFRYAYIEIARKNGKTALSAGVGCTCFLPMARPVPKCIRRLRLKIRRKSAFPMLWKSFGKPI